MRLKHFRARVYRGIENPREFVHNLVHAALQDEQGYVSNLTAAEIDDMLRKVHERRLHMALNEEFGIETALNTALDELTALIKQHKGRTHGTHTHRAQLLRKVTWHIQKASSTMRDYFQMDNDR